MEFGAPQFVEVAGRRLAYEECMPGDPHGTVLLLCGIGAKRQGWYKQLQEVETGEGARRVCSLVAGPGFAQRHPEAIEEFVEIARHNPMHVDAYFAARIGGAKLIVHEGVGHIPRWSASRRSITTCSRSLADGHLV